MRVLVTGATGFVGSALMQRVISEGRHVPRAAIRSSTSRLLETVECVTAHLGPEMDWAAAVNDVDAIVHLAARVHVMRDTSIDPLEEFRRVNVAGTLTLARYAAAAGVRRFLYLSTVKVNGESGTYVEADPSAPEDPYGRSKHEAEVGLRGIAAETGMQVVVIRPPLVYGPGARANFRTLANVVARGVPLPLGAVHNRRSLVGVDNLVDFICRCMEHPAAANETFLVSDGEDLSTTELIRRLARAMGRHARLIPVPSAALMAAATLVGRRDVARRLLGTLCVDISKARQQLGWTPPVSVDEGLRRAVAVR